MPTSNREDAERFLDVASSGGFSRRELMKSMAPTGLSALLAPSVIEQALAAGAVQADNRRKLANEYDYVIIGAGAAGCALARRLVDAGDASVLLIEAGGSDVGEPAIDVPAKWVQNIGSDRDWKYFYTPTEQIDNRRILLSRGKVLGGSSSTNALVWVRGAKSDYDGWAAQGADGWDFHSVLPTLKSMEDWEDGESDLRGAGGPIRVERAKNLHPVATALIEAGKSWGMPYIDDMNGPSNLGVGPINMNVRDGARVSAARGYLRPVLDRQNLTVITGAKATNLILEGQTCKGVHLLLGEESRAIRSTREVILCAGSVDTPRLLMLSGIGAADELRPLGIKPVVDLPGVGKNLQEHILLGGMIYEAKAPLPGFNNNLEGSTFFSKSNSTLPAPDLMFVTIQIPYATPELAAAHPLPENCFTLSPGLVGVKSRGYIKMLSNKHDGPLEIQPNLLLEPEDRAALLAGLKLGLEIADQPAFRDLIKGRVLPAPGTQTKPEMEAFIRQSASTYFHPVGTCRMGADKMSVVDSSNLKVHGIEGLRVADASIMPSITTANTHVPSILAGEMAAKMVMAR